MNIEEEIRKVFRLKQRWFDKTKVGSFQLEYYENAIPCVIFSDLMFEDGWRMKINEGIYATDYDDVANQVIEGYHNLLSQREKLISFGFEPVGLSKGLFRFKLQTIESEYFIYHHQELSSHGSFMGNTIGLDVFNGSHIPIHHTFNVDDLVKVVVSFFKSGISTNEKMSLNSKFRDELLKNEC